MRQIGKRRSTDAQVYLNQHYDVVAQNGIVIGSVRYSFHDGDKWCIAIQLLNGMPAYGESAHEVESIFDLKLGDAPWSMPVAQSWNYTPPADGDKVKALVLTDTKLVGVDLATGDDCTGYLTLPKE